MPAVAGTEHSNAALINGRRRLKTISTNLTDHLNKARLHKLQETAKRNQERVDNELARPRWSSWPMPTS